MSLEVMKLEGAWMVELHPKGGSRLRQVREVMREGLDCYTRGEPPEWVPVAIRPNVDEAKTALAKIRAELRVKRLQDEKPKTNQEGNHR